MANLQKENAGLSVSKKKINKPGYEENVLATNHEMARNRAIDQQKSTAVTSTEKQQNTTKAARTFDVYLTNANAPQWQPIEPTGVEGGSIQYKSVIEGPILVVSPSNIKCFTVPEETKHTSNTGELVMIVYCDQCSTLVN